jgi:hypothetical protein
MIVLFMGLIARTFLVAQQAAIKKAENVRNQCLKLE